MFIDANLKAFRSIACLCTHVVPAHRSNGKRGEPPEAAAEKKKKHFVLMLAAHCFAPQGLRFDRAALLFPSRIQRE